MPLLPESRSEANRPVEALVATLLAQADALPDRPAVRTPAGTISYGAFARRVRCAAAKIRRAIGRSRRTRRALRPQFARACRGLLRRACGRRGGRAAGCRHRRRKRALDRGRRRGPLGPLLAGDSTCRCPVANLAAWCRADEGEQLASPQCALEDPADLLYTTRHDGPQEGRPAHAREHRPGSAEYQCLSWAPAATTWSVMPLPLSHSFGLGRLRAWPRSGIACCCCRALRNPAAVLKQLLDARASGLALVPAGFDLILRMTKDRLGDAREHLRYIEIGSAAMPPGDETETAGTAAANADLPSLWIDRGLAGGISRIPCRSRSPDLDRPPQPECGNGRARRRGPRPARRPSRAKSSSAAAW